MRVQRTHAGSLPLRHHGIQGNRIHGNGRLGIELIDTAASEGAIPSDPAPARVNDGIPTPTLLGATGDGAGTGVTFALAEGEANTVYEFELFANAACDPSGWGEGQTPLARFTASTNAVGSLNDSAAAPPVPAGTVLTLTATRHGGSGLAGTSEFSACRTVAGGAAPGTPPAIGAIPNAQLTATVGQPYTLDLAAHVVLTEGDPIQSYALQGALPAWLSFDPATGVLTGTPAAVGSHAFTATATDKDGASAPRGFTLTVAAGRAKGAMVATRQAARRPSPRWGMRGWRCCRCWWARRGGGGGHRAHETARGRGAARHRRLSHRGGGGVLPHRAAVVQHARPRRGGRHGGRVRVGAAGGGGGVRGGVVDGMRPVPCACTSQKRQRNAKPAT